VGHRIYLVTAISSDPNSVLPFPLKGSLDTRPIRQSTISRHGVDKLRARFTGTSLVYAGEPKLSAPSSYSYAARRRPDGKHIVVFFVQRIVPFDMGWHAVMAAGFGRADQAAFDLPEYKWGSASSR